jgi:hypothetical protein
LSALLGRNPDPRRCAGLSWGLNHEEQHQELMLTDILHAFFTNPLRPKYQGMRQVHRFPGLNKRDLGSGDTGATDEFRGFDGGLREVGHAGDGFCFDNELPRHKVWLEPFSLAKTGW